MSRVVVALGGNALIHRGEEGSTAVQRQNLLVAARALGQLVASGHELVLTHGNGPQVGYLAIEADAARDLVPPPPLDVLVAELQGQIGYLLAQALTAQLTLDGRPRPVAPILTQTVVDPDDPAFAAPSKPVGPMYEEALARALGSEHGWTIARDGTGWRRVVPSPSPLEIVEATSVRALVAAGVIVIASGGGGIPVSRVADGVYVGVEAVVDKDLAAVVLAAGGRCRRPAPPDRRRHGARRLGFAGQRQAPTTHAGRRGGRRGRRHLRRGIDGPQSHGGVRVRPADRRIRRYRGTRRGAGGPRGSGRHPTGPYG